MNKKIKHGAALLNVKLYRVYRAMRQRCYSPSHEMYRIYGARGITVCQEWLDNPAAFVRWALAAGYVAGLSLDRIDNDGGYSPENCRWATRKEQGRNLRKNRMISWRGETRCMAEWGEITGISPQIIAVRLDRCGWSVDDALTIAPKKYRRLSAC